MNAGLGLGGSRLLARGGRGEERLRKAVLETFGGEGLPAGEGPRAFKSAASDSDLRRKGAPQLAQSMETYDEPSAPSPSPSQPKSQPISGGKIDPKKEAEILGIDPEMDESDIAGTLEQLDALTYDPKTGRAIGSLPSAEALLEVLGQDYLYHRDPANDPLTSFSELDVLRVRKLYAVLPKFDRRFAEAEHPLKHKLFEAIKSNAEVRDVFRNWNAKTKVNSKRQCRKSSTSLLRSMVWKVA
jgi:hypothetical protein